MFYLHSPLVRSHLCHQSLPHHYRHMLNTPALQYHYNTITIPSQYHYNTITIPLQCHYNTITIPLQYHTELLWKNIQIHDLWSTLWNFKSTHFAMTVFAI